MKVNTFFKIKIKKYYAVWKFINRIEVQDFPEQAKAEVFHHY